MATTTGSTATGGGSGGDPEFDAMVAEVGERIRAGLEVDVEAIAGGDPDRADRLRQLLPMMAMMNDLGRSAGAEAGDGDGDGPGSGVVGDYRLIRPIGRGGMGIVYEAHRLSINRRVALKILRPDAIRPAVDPNRVARFQVEAKAAGVLSHRHIVQVFDAGRDGNLYYYAMEYVDGPSLAEVVAVLRHRLGMDRGAAIPEAASAAAEAVASRLASRDDRPPDEDRPADDPEGAGPPGPAPAAVGPKHGEIRGASGPLLGRDYAREIARLGVQAADALHYAHRLGIVHRDVKPANLLVGSDDQLRVADFGLALVRDLGDLGLTGEGDRPGTLRYMSPEQAAPGTVPVLDHRTDIYSLGATFYELLTLRPAVDGPGHAIARRIAEDEPEAPRRLNPAIPRDLETIVLKAMAKDPAKRYDSAEELALDLARFLEFRPIAARRPTPIERVAKWSRRHRVPLISGVAGAIGVLAVSLWFIYGAYAAESRQRRRAESAAALTADALGDVALRIAGDNRLGKFGAEDLQAELLEIAIRRIEAFLALEGEGEADLARGRALNTRAQLLMALGRGEEALEAVGEAERAFEAIARRRGPSPSPEVRHGLATARQTRGTLLGFSGRSADEGLALLDRAIEEYEALLAQGWGDGGELRHRLALARNNRGNFLANVDPGAAIASYERALGDFDALAERGGYEAKPWLVKTLSNLGLLRLAIGQVDRAIGDQDEAVRRGRSFVAELDEIGPGPVPEARRAMLVHDLDLREALANALTNRGELRSEQGRAEEAAADFRDALAIYLRLAEIAPRHLEYPWSVAMSRTNLGWVLPRIEPGGAGEAKELLDQAHDWYEDALDADPANGSLAVYLGVNRLRLAEVEEAVAEAEGRQPGPPVASAFEEAIAAFRRAGDNPEALLQRAEALIRLGDLERSRGDPEAARSSWGRSLGVLERLAEAIGSNPRLDAMLAEARSRLDPEAEGPAGPEAGGGGADEGPASP